MPRMCGNDAVKFWNQAVEDCIKTVLTAEKDILRQGLLYYFDELLVALQGTVKLLVTFFMPFRVVAVTQWLGPRRPQRLTKRRVFVRKRAFLAIFLLSSQHEEFTLYNSKI